MKICNLNLRRKFVCSVLKGRYSSPAKLEIKSFQYSNSHSQVCSHVFRKLLYYKNYLFSIFSFVILIFSFHIHFISWIMPLKVSLFVRKLIFVVFYLVTILNYYFLQPPFICQIIFVIVIQKILFYSFLIFLIF